MSLVYKWDSALFYGTNASYLAKQSVFYPQTTRPAHFESLEEVEEGDVDYSSFGGLLGVMPVNSSEYIWYPVTDCEATCICYWEDYERTVVPCMDNKVLYLNRKNIKEIVLLNADYPCPQFYGLEPGDFKADIPLVVYEGLADYILADEESDDLPDPEIFPLLKMYLTQLIREKGWTKEQMHRMVSGIRIRYADGHITENDINFRKASSLVDEVGNLYKTENTAKYHKFLEFTDTKGAVTEINTETATVIELPLVGTERALYEVISGKRFSEYFNMNVEEE